MRFGLLSVLVCLLFFPCVGCGEASNNAFVEKMDMDFVANVKTDFEAIEKSGRLGSGVRSLMSNINAIKEKDPDKAEALSKGLDEMMKLQGEAKIKAKAKEILKLL